MTDFIVGWMRSLVNSNTWKWMNEKERETFLNRTVSQVVSEEELHKRLADVGCTEVMCDWLEVKPDDPELIKARDFYLRSGRPVSKTGALVSFSYFN